MTTTGSASTGLAIGEFSRLCHLSTKTLRYYHDIDLLVPAAVDASSGHRRYQPSQVTDAHLIRRLRGLDMPLAEIRTVLAEPDECARGAALTRHLDRMETELARTRDVVSSLRRLLDQAPPITVLYRSHAPTPVLLHAGRVARPDVGPWCERTFATLFARLAERRLDPASAPGTTYSAEFFEHDEGEVTAFVPVPPGAEPDVILPPRRYAVAVHAGPYTDGDLTYGALGAHVAEHDTTITEPIMELYLVGPLHTENPEHFRTEICWPVS